MAEPTFADCITQENLIKNETEVNGNTRNRVWTALSYLRRAVVEALSGKLGTTAQAADVNPAGSSISAALAAKLDADAPLPMVVSRTQWTNAEDPGSPIIVGDKWLITDPTALHANFGTLTGVVQGDVIEYIDDAWVVVQTGGTVWVDDYAGAIIYRGKPDLMERYTFRKHDAINPDFTASNSSNWSNPENVPATQGSALDELASRMKTAETAPGTLGVVFDGGGSALTSGVKADLVVPYNCTITKARLLADVSGSVVVDVWLDSYANYPPTVDDTITASAKPTLSSAIASEDATLTGWTTTLNAGDVLRFNIDSATTVTRVTLVLFISKR